MSNSSIAIMMCAAVFIAWTFRQFFKPHKSSKPPKKPCFKYKTFKEFREAVAKHGDMYDLHGNHYTISYRYKDKIRMFDRNGIRDYIDESNFYQYKTYYTEPCIPSDDVISQIERMEKRC